MDRHADIGAQFLFTLDLEHIGELQLFVVGRHVEWSV